VTLLVVGEALVDVLVQEGEDTEHAGGGPANIAVGLGRLGHDVTLLSCLGDDERGRVVRAHLEASDVAVLAAPLERTSTARASLDAAGLASYQFDITWDIRDLAPSTTPRWLHVGSIGATLQPGADQVSRLVSRYAGSTVVSYDPNIRPLLMSEADKPRIVELASRADVVKLSEEDAAWLHPGERPVDVAHRLLALGPRLVVVTLGGDGALAVLRGESAVVVAAPAPGGPVVDTVGAGDAFMSGLIDVLSGVDVDHLRVSDVRAALERAGLVARRTVERVGADPPRREELAGV
jgi:fructokinase